MPGLVVTTGVRIGATGTTSAPSSSLFIVGTAERGPVGDVGVGVSVTGLGGEDLAVLQLPQQQCPQEHQARQQQDGHPHARVATTDEPDARRGCDAGGHERPRPDGRADAPQGGDREHNDDRTDPANDDGCDRAEESGGRAAFEGTELIRRAAWARCR